MNWQDYQERFSEEARRQGMAPSFVAECLAYAEPLARAGLPVIYDIHHLALESGIPDPILAELLERPHAFYFHYRIPKRAGGFRPISEPLGPLRSVQRWILRNILDRSAPHDAATAFVQGRSIKMNAVPHKGQHKVLSLDIENFFGSVKVGMVVSVFLKMGYSSAVANALAGLTMFEGGLPQGAPSSPALSNLVLIKVDEALEHFASSLSIRYTRYADDMTFSGAFQAGPVIKRVASALGCIGLRINARKTRLMGRHQRQEVTGVVVNTKIQAARELRRQLRQEIYYLQRFGSSGHCPRSSSLHKNRLDHLRGVAEFIRFLNPSDRDAIAAIELLGRFDFSKNTAMET